MGFILLVFVFIFYLINKGLPEKVKGYTQGLLILLGLCSLYILLRTWNRDWEKRFNREIGVINFRRILMVIGLLIIYIFGLYIFGYFPMTVFFITVSLFLLEIRNWKIIVVTNIVLIMMMYILFIVFLKIPLPIGIMFGE